MIERILKDILEAKNIERRFEERRKKLEIREIPCYKEGYEGVYKFERLRKSTLGMGKNTLIYIDDVFVRELIKSSIKVSTFNFMETPIEELEAKEFYLLKSIMSAVKTFFRNNIDLYAQFKNKVEEEFSSDLYYDSVVYILSSILYEGNRYGKVKDSRLWNIRHSRNNLTKDVGRLLLNSSQESLEIIVMSNIRYKSDIKNISEEYIFGGLQDFFNDEYDFYIVRDIIIICDSRKLNNPREFILDDVTFKVYGEYVDFFKIDSFSMEFNTIWIDSLSRDQYAFIRSSLKRIGE